jgi:hypothetical protein
MRRKHSAAGLKLLRELDKELVRASERQGCTLVWSAQERECLAMLATTVDRRELVQAALDRCDPDDRKSLVAYSQEIRQLDSAVERLLKSLSTEAPVTPESLTTIKARRAAQARWDRERNAASRV